LDKVCCLVDEQRQQIDAFQRQIQQMTKEQLISGGTCRSLEAALSDLHARQTDILHAKEKAESNSELLTKSLGACKAEHAARSKAMHATCEELRNELRAAIAAAEQHKRRAERAEQAKASLTDELEAVAANGATMAEAIDKLQWDNLRLRNECAHSLHLVESAQKDAHTAAELGFQLEMHKSRERSLEQQLFAARDHALQLELDLKEARGAFELSQSRLKLAVTEATGRWSASRGQVESAESMGKVTDLLGSLPRSDGKSVVQHFATPEPEMTRASANATVSSSSIFRQAQGHDEDRSFPLALSPSAHELFHQTSRNGQLLQAAAPFVAPVPSGPATPQLRVPIEAPPFSAACNPVRLARAEHSDSTKLHALAGGPTSPALRCDAVQSNPSRDGDGSSSSAEVPHAGEAAYYALRSSQAPVRHVGSDLAAAERVSEAEAAYRALRGGGSVERAIVF
jgi:hypothetical protein